MRKTLILILIILLPIMALSKRTKKKPRKSVIPRTMVVPRMHMQGGGPLTSFLGPLVEALRGNTNLTGGGGSTILNEFNNNNALSTFLQQQGVVNNDFSGIGGNAGLLMQLFSDDLLKPTPRREGENLTLSRGFHGYKEGGGVGGGERPKIKDIDEFGADVNHDGFIEEFDPIFKSMIKTENVKLDPDAESRTGARGMGQQVTKATKDFNMFNPFGLEYSHDEMFDPHKSLTVAHWQWNQRTPQLLDHFGVKDSTTARLYAYNCGASCTAKKFKKYGCATNDPGCLQKHLCASKDTKEQEMCEYVNRFWGHYNREIKKSKQGGMIKKYEKGGIVSKEDKRDIRKFLRDQADEDNAEKNLMIDLTVEGKKEKLKALFGQKAEINSADPRHIAPLAGLEKLHHFKKGGKVKKRKKKDYQLGGLTSGNLQDIGELLSVPKGNFLLPGDTASFSPLLLTPEDLEKLMLQGQQKELFRKGGNIKKDKVSKKISKLIKREGKSQEQAIAIALDMARRNKLQQGGPIPVDPRGLHVNRGPVVIPSRDLSFRGIDTTTIVQPIDGVNAVLEVPVPENMFLVPVEVRPVDKKKKKKKRLSRRSVNKKNMPKKTPPPDKKRYSVRKRGPINTGVPESRGFMVRTLPKRNIR